MSTIITRTATVTESPLVGTEATLTPIGPAATKLTLDGLYESWTRNVDSQSFTIELRERHSTDPSARHLYGKIRLRAGDSWVQVWVHTALWPEGDTLGRRQVADAIARILDTFPGGHWPSGWKELVVGEDR